ncbi:hypothetical protein BDZ45DRAFT_677983 [Acephala macrosclerotiorum]|nr:hypothetical protein BDZ45DRAFT_677983 [Acephala macrosclerotiorum]
MAMLLRSAGQDQHKSQGRDADPSVTLSTNYDDEFSESENAESLYSADNAIADDEDFTINVDCASDTTTQGYLTLRYVQSLLWWCCSCRYRCQGYAAIEKHFLRHSRTLSYECKTHNQNFTTLKELRGHMQMPHIRGSVQNVQWADTQGKVVNTITCRYGDCPTTTKNEGEYFQHCRDEHWDINYKCWYCKESFTSSKELKSHCDISHTGMMELECFVPGCTLIFKRPNFLFRHLPTHLPDRIFSCNICSISFETPKSYTLHCIQEFHPASDICVKCPYKYSEETEYIRHYLRDHSEICSLPGAEVVAEILQRNDRFETAGKMALDQETDNHDSISDLVRQARARGEENPDDICKWIMNKHPIYAGSRKTILSAFRRIFGVGKRRLQLSHFDLPSKRIRRGNLSPELSMQQNHDTNDERGGDPWDLKPRTEGPRISSAFSAEGQDKSPQIPATVPAESEPPLATSRAAGLDKSPQIAATESLPAPLQICVPTATLHPQYLTQQPSSNSRLPSNNSVSTYGDLPEVHASTDKADPSPSPRQPIKCQVPFWIRTSQPHVVQEPWRNGHIGSNSLATFTELLSTATQRSGIEEIKFELKASIGDVKYSVKKDEEVEWVTMKEVFAEHLALSRAGDRRLKIVVEPIYGESLLGSDSNDGVEFMF